MIALWRRNMIALSHGIVLKPSGKMKWLANIDVHGAKPEETVCYGLFPVEADTALDAARNAALAVAKALFGERGDTSFIAETRPLFFTASIGVYQGGGVTKGRSLSIALQEYRGEQ